MEEYVEIPIPEDFEESKEDLCLYFQNECDEESNFICALDLECEPQNSRAVLDKVIVTSVEQFKDQITIEYSIELSQYQPCKDVQGTWDFDRILIGVRIGNVWKFKIHVSTEERSTYEEF